MASHMENENENENEDVNYIENTVKGADFLRIFFDEKCVIRVSGKEQTICTLYGMVFLGRWDEDPACLVLGRN